MERESDQSVTAERIQSQVVMAERPAYEPPRVTVMDEAEVLKAFQFTSAGISWWVM
jgi:hypothetical protein